MFIGHYSAALALKGSEKKASLGWLFLAAQLPDILISLFVLLGIERVNMVENYTQSTNYQFAFIPYSHSLVGSFAWAVVAYVIARTLPAKKVTNRKTIALVVAVAVFSHWVLDWIVHTPDLPVLGNGSPKVGLGLWNNAPLTFTLEAVLLLAGVWLYLRATRGTTVIGKYGMVSFAVVLIIANAVNIFVARFDSAVFWAISSLLLYCAIGGAAFWLDRKRS